MRGDAFWSEIALRAIKISEITCGKKSDLGYIKELLSSERAREINRKYHLLYYGDQEIKDVTGEKELVYEGFDIYNTYNALVRKLTEKQETSLYRLELFTLCDLLLHRLDKKVALTRSPTGRNTVDAYFYSDKFIQGKDNKATRILMIAKKQIEYYLEKNSWCTDCKEFCVYLETVKWEFNQQLRVVSKDESIRPRPFAPEKLLNQCSQMEIVPRIGWNISDSMSIMTSEQYQKALEKETLETVLEHSYEAYLIGLFYLPDTIPGQGKYKKEKTLTLLLIHDLGEAVTGDYPPFYEKYEKKKECECQ